MSFLPVHMSNSLINNLPEKAEVVQTSITMERQLKERYSRLAVTLDLSFSQLVRYALKRLDEGCEDSDSTTQELVRHIPEPPT
jgi:hypothetical protein